MIGKYAPQSNVEPAFSTFHKALESELSNKNDELSKLQGEAEEMQEKLRKLDRQDKHEKGHNAMTEELRKMEVETGIKVSDRPLWGFWATSFFSSPHLTGLGIIPAKKIAEKGNLEQKVQSHN